jgi:hypothetical protein
MFWNIIQPFERFKDQPKKHCAPPTQAWQIRRDRSILRIQERPDETQDRHENHEHSEAAHDVLFGGFFKHRWLPAP